MLAKYSQRLPWPFSFNILKLLSHPDRLILFMTVWCLLFSELTGTTKKSKFEAQLLNDKFAHI